MCTVPLPPGVNPIAVNKYIIISLLLYVIHKLLPCLVWIRVVIFHYFRNIIAFLLFFKISPFSIWWAPYFFSLMPLKRKTTARKIRIASLKTAELLQAFTARFMNNIILHFFLNFFASFILPVAVSTRRRVSWYKQRGPGPVLCCVCFWNRR